MRRTHWLAPLLLAACDGDGQLRDLLVWDEDRACYAVEEDAVDLGELRDRDCPEAPTPAVRADGACVVLPVACFPRGFTASGASAPECGEALRDLDVRCDEDASSR